MMIADPSILDKNRRLVVHGAPILILVIGLFLLIHAEQLFAVPALENQSLVVGEVLEKIQIDSMTIGVQPEQKLWRFKLRVVSVESVAGLENLLRGQEGKIIEVFSNEVNAPADANRRITVRISFHGDERAGRYWIIGTNEMNAK